MSGNPKARDISISFVERQNLTMRMQVRRFTRPPIPMMMSMVTTTTTTTTIMPIVVALRFSG
jgi:hypothetical protein